MTLSVRLFPGTLREVRFDVDQSRIQKLNMCCNRHVQSLSWANHTVASNNGTKKKR